MINITVFRKKLAFFKLVLVRRGESKVGRKEKKPTFSNNLTSKVTLFFNKIN